MTRFDLFCFVIWVVCIFILLLLSILSFFVRLSLLSLSWQSTGSFLPFFRQTASDSCAHHLFCPRAIGPGTKDASSQASLSPLCSRFHCSLPWLVSLSSPLICLSFCRAFTVGLALSVFSLSVYFTPTIHHSLCSFISSLCLFAFLFFSWPSSLIWLQSFLQSLLFGCMPLYACHSSCSFNGAEKKVGQFEKLFTKLNLFGFSGLPEKNDWSQVRFIWLF